MMRFLKYLLVMLTITTHTLFSISRELTDNTLAIHNLLLELPENEQQQFQHELKQAVQKHKLLQKSKIFFDNHPLLGELQKMGITIAHTLMNADFSLMLSVDREIIGKVDLALPLYGEKIIRLNRLWIKEEFRNQKHYRLGSKLFNFVADYSDTLLIPIHWTAQPFDLYDGSSPEKLPRLLRFYKRNGGTLVQKYADHAVMKYIPLSRSGNMSDNLEVIEYNPQYA